MQGSIASGGAICQQKIEAGASQPGEELEPVLVVAKDAFAIVAAIHHMVANIIGALASAPNARHGRALLVVGLPPLERSFESIASSLAKIDEARNFDASFSV